MKPEEQSEAIAFSPDGLGFFSTSEGFARPIYYYEFSDPSVAAAGSAGISVGAVLIAVAASLGINWLGVN